VIYRENASRRIDIGADVQGRDIGAVTRDVEQRLQAIQFPLGYHVEVLGEYAERQAAEQHILLAALAAVVVIFFLLYASFRIWRLTILTFFTLPWALVGGLLAAYFLSDGVLSLARSSDFSRCWELPRAMAS